MRIIKTKSVLRFGLTVLSSLALLSACSSKPESPDLNGILSANRVAAKELSDRIGNVLTTSYALLPLKNIAPLTEKLNHEIFLPKQPGATKEDVNPAFNAIVLEEQGLPAWAPKPPNAVPDEIGPVSGLFPTSIAYSVESVLMNTYNGNPLLTGNPIYVDGIKSALTALPQLRYVLVLHPIRAVMPQRTTTDEFSPGMYEGEVRLFDIRNASYLGGFVFSAKTDATITVNANHYDSVEIKYNLVENARDMLLRELSARGLM